jgi:NADH:ubiquinone oxidoreductase subunit F (NADH-binding)/(2Fe-2S) ferredoxin/NAD-dependent dihydropyrimidine dehydrogenase PreA subunit
MSRSKNMTNPIPSTTHISVCSDSGCLSGGGEAVRQALCAALETRGLAGKVEVRATGCFGFCEQGPIIITRPDDTFYVRVKPKDAESIIDQHILGGSVIERLLYKDPETHQTIPTASGMNFYAKQQRRVLRRVGEIDPESVEHYLATDGYLALEKALKEMTPESVAAEVERSGLRGRGGAGFPAGIKWRLARQAKGERKFVICNADEGDPGAFMNRSLLEGDPHAVLEGLILAGYAVGAQQGYVYIRAEYPRAVRKIQGAIRQAYERCFLGKNILGSGFDFDVETRLGAGAFVCGEETALLQSIEGKRGMPVPRPPFPAEKGLWGCPTTINNVETLANVPAIIHYGFDWLGAVGTEKSKGTKTFALAGKVNNTGLIEVPLGITLREVIDEIGGGVLGGKQFKLAQIGGPSGGCIPAEHLDTPIDYESLRSLGAIMGSGGLVVMDEDNCAVDVAHYFLSFIQAESCGKCPPCRLGTKQMLDILERIREGEGEPSDITALEKLSGVIQRGSLCGLGQTAPNPVLTTLRYFRHEYEAHVNEKRCPGRVCKALITFSIQTDRCNGCTLCARACPAEAIVGSLKEPHAILMEKCLRCGACLDACNQDAVLVN